MFDFVACHVFEYSEIPLVIMPMLILFTMLNVAGLISKLIARLDVSIKLCPDGTVSRLVRNSSMVFHAACPIIEPMISAFPSFSILSSNNQFRSCVPNSVPRWWCFSVSIARYVLLSAFVDMWSIVFHSLLLPRSSQSFIIVLVRFIILYSSISFSVIVLFFTFDVSIECLLSICSGVAFAMFRIVFSSYLDSIFVVSSTLLIFHCFLFVLCF